MAHHTDDRRSHARRIAAAVCLLAWVPGCGFGMLAAYLLNPRART